MRDEQNNTPLRRQYYFIRCSRFSRSKISAGLEAPTTRAASRGSSQKTLGFLQWFASTFFVLPTLEMKV